MSADVDIWIPAPAPGDDPDAAETRAYVSGMRSAPRVAFDFRPRQPRYRVIRHGRGLHMVYVFTDRFVWDRIAGGRLTRWGADRLGRRALRKARSPGGGSLGS